MLSITNKIDTEERENFVKTYYVVSFILNKTLNIGKNVLL